MPSMPAASNGGEERVAHTGSAVTRPAASCTGTRIGGQPGRAARSVTGTAPGVQRAGGGHVADERTVSHDRR